MQVQRQKSLGSNSQTTWDFDPSHTIVEFSVSNLFFFTVKGLLTALDGTIVLDEHDMSRSSVAATFKADSIDTGNRQRDAHLRSADFLATNTYPHIVFQSSSVGHGKDRDTFKVTGALNIRGKTGEVVLDVSEVDRSKSPRGEEVIYYVATTELNRHDFGINYRRGLIGRTLRVTINVQASRPI
jgi:polyisoprenoid-binding protein YceI